MLFQCAVTFATLQRAIPGFRHNDLSWYNARSTMPNDVTWTREYKGWCQPPCPSLTSTPVHLKQGEKSKSARLLLMSN